MLLVSRARLTGRDAATAQLRNLAGQPAGRLRFKLKFQAAGANAEAARLSPPPSQRVSDSGRSAGGIQAMVDGDRRFTGHDAGSLPYSRRVSDSNSVPRRVSEAGSYRSTGSTDGRRSATPNQGLPYATTALERRPSGGLRAAQQGLGPRRSGEEPDVVLASVTSKVSLAKQAMQQLTAELAELTGPGQSPQARAVHSSLSHSAHSSGSLQPSAFASSSAQQMPFGSSHSESRSSSRQGGVALNVLGQPVQQQQQPVVQQNSAWSDYKSLWQQQRHQHQRPAAGAAPMGEADSWNMAGGQELPMPGQQQQQQYYDRRKFRVSTGSLTPSGVISPSDMLSPSMSPRASMAAGMSHAEGMGVAWPRLRGVFGNGVLSTEELVALYANSAPASEKKLVNILEDALAAAHAERVRVFDCYY